jgi:phospholipid N-methyltransferase
MPSPTRRPESAGQPSLPAGRGAGSDRWLFFTKFLRQGTTIGAVVPSSRWFARKLVRDIDFAAARCVVELGAGTGPITTELLRRGAGRCRTLVIERDPDFCARLRQRFPTAEVIEADACDLSRLLAERQIATVDHVLCGVALPWFTAADRHRLLDSARRHLAPQGTFRQLTYMPWLHTHVYRRYFHRVGFRFVLRNVPPGGFYVCRGPLSKG